LEDVGQFKIFSLSSSLSSSFFSFVVLGIESKISHILGKCYATELCVTQAGLELPILLSLSPSAGITGIGHHALLCFCFPTGEMVMVIATCWVV
jgi:hypothetical protein